MSKGIYEEIERRITEAPCGSVFVTSDFKDVAAAATVRKCLGRQVDENRIIRIIDGVYEKPKYSKLLGENVSTNPDTVAKALARAYHWTIAPCGDVALHLLGLSTQVPAVWSYISDGPYRSFSWGSVSIQFKHRANREISNLSEISSLIVEAIKALKKERVDDNVIAVLKKRIPDTEKEKILRETIGVSDWVYSVIRKVCG